MKTLFALLVLLCCGIQSAFAQDDLRPIEERMPLAEQQAIGIDKMTPEQLARLNAWLRKDAGLQATQVREQLREEVKNERKGFGTVFGSRDEEPIVSKIAGEFLGWSAGTVFTLQNGQRWRVIDTPEYYVAKRKASMDPAVSVTPSLMGSWRLQVEGHTVRAKVKRLD